MSVDDRGIDEFGEVAVKKLRQAQKYLSDAEIQEIIDLYQSGKATTRDLADKFHCHRQTISHTLKQHGVKVDKRKAQKKWIPKRLSLCMKKCIQQQKSPNSLT